MKLINRPDAKEFMDVVNSCDGEVYIQTDEGDTYNMKSSYVTVLRLQNLFAKDTWNLYCSSFEEEQLFSKWY